MTKSNKGQNLAEITSLIALVVIVGVCVYQMMGNNINSMFNLTHKEYKTYKPFDWDSSNNNINNTNTNSNNQTSIATTDSPIVNCNNGKCTLDFGDYVLTGMPANLSEFIETSGSSAGTDALASIIQQLADQLANEGKKEESTDLSNLANMAYFMADYQKQSELFAQQCSSDSNPELCYKNKINSNKSLALPDELKSLLPGYKTTDSFALNRAYTNLGVGMRQKDYQQSFFSEHENGYVGFAMANLIDNVIDNPNISDSIKGVVKEAYYNIGYIDYIQNGEIVSIQRQQTMPTIFYDPITSDFNVTTSFHTANDMNKISNPQTSVTTDLTATLICAASSQQNNCH